VRANFKTNLSEKMRLEITRWAIQMILTLIVFGVLLFVSAGQLKWREGWAFLGLNALTQLPMVLLLVPRRPDLIAERAAIREGTKNWDRCGPGYRLGSQHCS
jgi:hypothetical protein